MLLVSSKYQSSKLYCATHQDQLGSFPSSPTSCPSPAILPHRHQNFFPFSSLQQEECSHYTDNWVLGDVCRKGRDCGVGKRAWRMKMR